MDSYLPVVVYLRLIMPTQRLQRGSVPLASVRRHALGMGLSFLLVSATSKKERGKQTVRICANSRLSLFILRYCNMDFIVFSSIQTTILLFVLISYDIYCQWSKKLWTSRYPSFPPDLQLDLKRTEIDGVIPKFHIPAHKEGCHTIYSLNLRPGAGRTDGEGIERDWSAMNAAAKSTKEMSEGSRHDALDDFWGV